MPASPDVKRKPSVEETTHIVSPGQVELFERKEGGRCNSTGSLGVPFNQNSTFSICDRLVWKAFPFHFVQFFHVSFPRTGLAALCREDYGRCVYLDTNFLGGQQLVQNKMDGIEPTANASFIPPELAFRQP